MKINIIKKRKYEIQYLFFFCISGCSYQVFIYLKESPLLSIGIYSFITVFIVYLPLYSLIEQFFIRNNSLEDNGEQRKTIQFSSIKTALKKYPWAIVLGVIFSAGWQVITYKYLINRGIEGSILALLVTSFARLIEPILAKRLFGDKIGNPVYYWLGFMISLIGVVMFEYSSKDTDQIDESLTILYYSLSILAVFFIAYGSMLKRFITANLDTDITPVKDKFLGVNRHKEYFMPVRLRTLIVNTFTGIILITASILFSAESLNFTTQQVMALVWIGAIGGMGYTLSLRLKNIVPNTKTAVLDVFRNVILYLFFPVLIVVFSLGTKNYTLNLGWLSISGLVLSTLGGLVSIHLGKPDSMKVKKLLK